MKFKIIMADDPWEYNNKNTGGSFKSGANAKYNTLSLQELIDLPVKQIVDKNALLFLWVPTPLSNEIAKSGIVESWGFKEVVTKIYWIKTGSLGLGFNFRNQVEECWMCRRGTVKSFRTALPNVIMSKPGKHSEKPKELFEMIEPSIEKFKLYPCLEMFARKKRKNWMAIGNEITGNDIRIDLLNLITDNILDDYRSG
jgi:N6-adenosine-specific RNA methylase IME4